ncbi:unnamed protein product [Discosporangium mesarthrocarpum]
MIYFLRDASETCLGFQFDCLLAVGSGSFSCSPFVVFSYSSARLQRLSKLFFFPRDICFFLPGLSGGVFFCNTRRSCSNCSSYTLRDGVLLILLFWNNLISVLFFLFVVVPSPGPCRVGRVAPKLQVQQSALAQASRQEAARLGATHSKLSKDYKRVNTIVEELINQATRRMEDTDSQRKGQEEALMGQDLGQDLGQGQGYRGGSGFGVVMGGREGGGVGGSSLGQQTLQMQMQEEAINTAIIQETEEELQNINQSLYKVNEIFRDLASIVESQQEQVEHIEINTEAAHARAQQGLAQVVSSYWSRLGLELGLVVMLRVFRGCLADLVCLFSA